ncbi:MAG: hypothetical protein ACREE6_05650 [Limisphaerales bacterium]
MIQSTSLQGISVEPAVGAVSRAGQALLEAYQFTQEGVISGMGITVIEAQ